MTKTYDELAAQAATITRADLPVWQKGDTLTEKAVFLIDGAFFTVGVITDQVDIDRAIANGHELAYSFAHCVSLSHDKLDWIQREWLTAGGANIYMAATDTEIETQHGRYMFVPNANQKHTLVHKATLEEGLLKRVTQGFTRLAQYIHEFKTDPDEMVRGYRIDHATALVDRLPRSINAAAHLITPIEAVALIAQVIDMMQELGEHDLQEWLSGLDNQLCDITTLNNGSK